ncbi:MAG: phosphotransferase [Alphaproteobacteria bacterium]|nr:phosphotransferase [Alphaproteobacteria bacterium]MDE2110909.1 phosphotransferase [Alphaproteobacteria bacterium]MDE2495392.1 phosphotransferase [Alphaproteobacteria bacterium]
MPVDRTAAIRDFLKRAGWGEAQHIPLPGDASTRRYVRLLLNSRQAMLMDQPQSAEAPAVSVGASASERRILGYNAVARLAGADCACFVAIAHYLRDRGLSAPEIYAADLVNGFVLIEDLGDALFADILTSGADEHELYLAAVEVLALLHAHPAPPLLSLDKCLHAYDETALLAEIDLLTQWYFPVALGRAADDAEIEEHRSLWCGALAPFLQAPSVFVHRDYHAQNLLWLPSRSSVARVGLIDFQDAVTGSKAYDLVSLIEDARRDVTPALGTAATEHYLATMRRQGTPLDGEVFAEEMAVFAAQRNTKIVGIFARLFRRDGKSRYLSYLPRVWSYLQRDLEHPALAALKTWYDRAIPREARGIPQGGGI